MLREAGRLSSSRYRLFSQGYEENFRQMSNVRSRISLRRERLLEVSVEAERQETLSYVT